MDFGKNIMKMKEQHWNYTQSKSKKIILEVLTFEDITKIFREDNSMILETILQAIINHGDARFTGVVLECSKTSLQMILIITLLNHIQICYFWLLLI
ncbi:hypothetical protein MH117_16990 [Paenibacillus sp. ACRRX]|uniref:hypothetical protein n=1 Tax=Paenibacillus sp. ACRRX TaxID=2918206 RepID=UPI001EF6FD21|nr:hypothetical protein [Paenibacillus sp. ACRRX]MCG7409116.1 hypothetical protein [Paenibacillus sp. ACRRX]